MLPYFKKYSILVCLIAILLPLIVSTVYPLFTGGGLIASSIGGLIGLFLLFIVGLLVGFSIFERRAQSEAQKWIDFYDADCDPQAFISAGKAVADAVSLPCAESGAWYLGVYAQALLDIGQIDAAKKIYQGLMASMDSAKKSVGKVGVLVNIVPLAEKLDTDSVVMELIEKGLALCSQEVDPISEQRRDYLLSQKEIMRVRCSGDDTARAHMDSNVVQSAAYPLRVRVEFAWDEASCWYRLGNAQAEKQALSFVADHGNKLVLAKQATYRLSHSE